MLEALFSSFSRFTSLASSNIGYCCLWISTHRIFSVARAHIHTRTVRGNFQLFSVASNSTFNNTSQQVMEKRENWVYYFIISFFFLLALWFLLRLLLAAKQKVEEPCEKLLAARFSAAAQFSFPPCRRLWSRQCAYKLSQFSWFHLI